MIRILVVMAVLLMGTALANEINLDCDDNRLGIRANLIVNNDENYFNRADMFSMRTGYRSYLNLHRTFYSCFNREYCYEGRDLNYYYKFDVPEGAFEEISSTFFLVKLELYNLRTNRTQFPFLSCRKW